MHLEISFTHFCPCQFIFPSLIFAAPDGLPLALTDRLQNAEPCSEVNYLGESVLLGQLEQAKWAMDHQGAGGPEDTNWLTWIPTSLLG